PEAGFYLWADVGGDDAAFARELHRRYNVLVLPGSFLGRPGADGRNPAAGRVRIALVDRLEACLEAAERIVRLRGG
ncbi:succinyldiaminopimelate transaminase, partial [Klebsiella pneumoniae]|nr:succinyldiaminopimelate transaminase [Klebsiella pneumoniae]